MIERGSCSFTQKVYNAQLAGAEAVIVYDNVYQPFMTMRGDDHFAGLVKIPSVFVTRRIADYVKQRHTQEVFLTSRDSIPMGPPYSLLSFVFMVTFLAMCLFTLSVLLNRLCCFFPRRTYHINSAMHEPSESATYVEFVEAEMMEDEEQEDKESGEDNANEAELEENEDDDDSPTIRFSKNDGLSEPFLVSV